MGIGAVFNADSEYRLEKIVRPVSRDLWSIFDFFNTVTVFQSTTSSREKKSRSRFFIFRYQNDLNS